MATASSIGATVRGLVSTVVALKQGLVDEEPWIMRPCLPSHTCRGSSMDLVEIPQPLIVTIQESITGRKPRPPQLDGRCLSKPPPQWRAHRVVNWIGEPSLRWPWLRYRDAGGQPYRRASPSGQDVAFSPKA
ncbi:hypothetical protein MRX96_022426 [Rhipicephalus microplus]